MRNILFIKNYRSGTNLWNFLNGAYQVAFSASKLTSAITGGTPLINPEVEQDDAEGWWLPTVPPKTCRCSLWIHRQPDPEDVEFRAWHTNVGDWWGYAKSADVPGPYDLKTPATYSSESS